MKRSSVTVAATLCAALAGCGADRRQFRTTDSSLALATADEPGQRAVVSSTIVTLSGRSAAPEGTQIQAVALDATMTPRSCTGTVTSDHTWSCAVQLPDGGYTWSAQADTGRPSQAVDFVVRTWSVQAPLADRLPPVINDPTPVITGTVDASLLYQGYHLEVTEGGKAICIVYPVTSTNWSCALTKPLAEGPHVLASDVDESSGDELTPSSNPVAFVVKTRIGTPTVDAIPSPTNAAVVPFSGTGEPGATLSVLENGSAMCEVPVTAGGSWQCVADRMPEGSHVAVVEQTDGAGNVSATTSVAFVVDRHVPSAPGLDAPASPSRQPRITLSGEGEAGDALVVSDSYSHLICAARVGADSRWSCTTTLNDGDYLLSAAQTSGAGTRSCPSKSVPLSVRTLLAPLFDALRSPTRDASPLLTGTAAANAQVVVYVGENPLCAARADASGRWSCKPSAALADGAYLLQARVTDDLAHVSDASARAVVIDTTPPAAPVIAQLPSPTRKRQPVVSGTAEAASTVAIMEASSGAAVCTVTAEASGAFHCAASAAMAMGPHTITATATDAAGNTSGRAQPVTVVISDTIPGRPTIEKPSNGAEVEGRRPLISGRTDPGTLVQVSLDGQTYTAQLDGKGLWVLFPPSDLAAGEHHVQAAATDAQQNASDVATGTFRIVDLGFARGGCASGGVPAPLFAVAALLFVALRRKKAAAALVLASIPSLSRAAELDVSLFRPAAAGDGLAATEGARPPLDGERPLELRTWTDFAIRPLSFLSQSGDQRALVRSRTGEFLGAQVHLLGPLSLALQVPLTLDEHGDLSGLPPSSRGPSTLLGGFGDLRLTPRLALLREEWAGIDLATQASFEFPTARARTLSSDGTVRAEGLVALGRQLGAVPGGDLSLLANGYVRVRPAHEFLDVKSGTEAGVRAGLGLALKPMQSYVPRRVYLEAEGRSFLRGGFAPGTAPAEWRAGGTVCPAGNLAIDLAAGTALTDGVGAPRARFLFGFGWSPSACGRHMTPALATVAPGAREMAPAADPAAGEPPIAPLVRVPRPNDRDGDGIPDADDACPDQPGPRENHGCPVTIRQRVVVSATKIRILEKILFTSGRAQINPRSYGVLDQVAAVLNSHPDLLVVRVEGHTDRVGSPARNLALSQARAEVVAAYLEAKGVDSRRLRAKGFGLTRPIASNRTAAGRAANRRVAFSVLKMRAKTIEAQRPPDS